MAQEFEGDLAGAVFWGADLSGSRFRDVDLTGSRISHAWLVDVEIDALVERLVVNGVDVTDHVNERDPWYPLRAMLRPADPAAARDTWAALEAAWTTAISRARALPDGAVHTSVGGEWSFVQTLRHLVFAMDKWFTVPILGGAYHPAGLPHTGAADDPALGLDGTSEPSLDEALAVRADRSTGLRDYLVSVTSDDLTREIEVSDVGPVPLQEGLFTVFEEEFWHLRYAVRDLEQLAVAG